MDVFVLQAIARELDTALRGARLEKAAQPEFLTVLLGFSGPGRKGLRVILSADPAHPRVHLTADNPPGLAEPPDFCRSLRRHLAGCRVARVAAGEWERVIQISLERPGGGSAAFALMAEVMGRWSNIVLVEGRSGRILDAIRLVPADQSPGRPILRNAAYRLPPPQKKIAPDSVEEGTLHRRVAEAGMEGAGREEMARWLVKTFSGVSPLVAAEVASRSGPGEGWRGLWPTLSQAVAAYRERRFRPALLLGPEGAPRGISALDLVGLGSERVRPCSTMNEAADAFYAGIVGRSALVARKARLAKALARHLKRVRRNLGAVERDLRQGEEAEEVRRKGEILIENLGRVEERASVFVAEREGRRLEIALDPRFSASANAQRYFRRYKKLKRLRAACEARRGEVEGERDFLEGLLYDLEEAQTLDGLDGVEAALGAAGYGPEERGDGKPRRRPRGRAGSTAQPYRRFRSPGGWEIFVGKSALGNDALLRRVGREGDIWLHAQGLPGSHVLLRAPGGPGEEALLQAGALAAYHSRGRAEGRVRVDYLPVQRLRRPRGARPGQVLFTGQRTLLASPAEGERLLGELEEIDL